MDYVTVRVLPVLAASVWFLLLGGLWYGAVFARSWAALIGKTPEEIKAGEHPMMYFWAFVASLVGSYALAIVIEATLMTTMIEGACIGLIAGIGFVATAMGSSYTFRKHPVKLWLIDAGFQVTALTIAGGIIGGWR